MSSDLPARLEALVEKWRNSTQVRRHPVYRGMNGDVDADGFEPVKAEEKAVLVQCASELAAALVGAEPPADQRAQVFADAAEIRSSYGFVMMRLAVAKDADDAYDVLKREWREHEAAFKRLETSLPAPPGAASPQVYSAEQLIADVLADRGDELDKAACDRCEDCGTLVMCRFHSVLSELQRQVWTNARIQRDNGAASPRVGAPAETKDKDNANIQK